MPRILIFSPYQLWGIHTIYEETLAKACQARGAEVEYLLCDGLPECDQHWDSKSQSPRPFDLCQRCQAKAQSNLQNLGFPHRWLTNFISPAERTTAFEWAQSVKPSELRDASFQEFPIGQWVFSSVISYFRQYPPDLENWHVVSVYRGFLFSGAIVALSLKHCLEANPVDAAILFNGRQSLTRVALEIFHGHGIRVLTHERAEYNRGHINARQDAHCMDPRPFKHFWEEWGKIPLEKEQLEAALSWLIQRRYGANLAWIPFNKSSPSHSPLRSRFNLNPEGRLWALFTSSTDEVAGDPLLRGPYESQFDWVRDVVDWVAVRKDVQLIIKVHPNLGGNYYIGQATQELRLYQELKSKVASNVRVILPEDSVSAYSLAEEADVGLTFGSTIGLEMAMMGKPILLASRALYDCCSEIYTVRTREELPGLLDKCLGSTRTREIQRQAFRLAYYYIFRFELPFPKVQVLDVFDAKLNYSDRSELLLGLDRSLDHLCEFLMQGRPVHPDPISEDYLRTEMEENLFFKTLGHSVEYLQSSRIETWLKWKSIGRITTRIIRQLPFGAGEVFLNSGRRRWHAFLATMERGERGSNHKPKRDAQETRFQR
jgi:hypothetical protein